MISKIALSFFILAFNLTSCSKKEIEEIQPTIGEVTESVYASGVIKAEGQYTVYSTVNGTLQKINGKVGQFINKGQTLFELESDKAELNIENARLAYQLNEESSRYNRDKIAEIELKVQSAKDKLVLDESILNRNKNVIKQGGISEVDFERIELAYKSSKINYQSTQKQLTQLKAQLKNDQSRNSNNLRLSQESKNDFNIKSAFSGQLFDVSVKEGTFITPQVPLAIIGQANSFLLELEVDENDMVRVKIGQKVIVTMDSYKGKIFDASIDKIYPIMNERSRAFKIEAHFIKPPEKLYPNLTAESNIIIQIKKNAITIPKSYLVDGKYVLVNKDEKRKVITGLSDYEKVEILSGLTADETIYKPK
ncbi:RND family efflux transporter, MFP subunit [Flavobacterium micromati]|uniref:RND family efflux transporter, MFP subunit n=1 Tax=Flavobacterium micromati TaxID=229205 RepID=A0A1M5HX86_9FLAO|nr:efflux RND transporter periplasmic adaptor subunit [Flavobacterium micromati]MCL6462291.1 efflux RND transporter periplasmic adaptor subunit [Flavobacterium micromati]SHG20575.1 RND family efflux transporter, MFP subunit [Flavobacterium micromati]